MKAVVFDGFGGPEVLRLADLEVPEPAEGQVLVQMRSAGVCKADWRVRTGRCQWLHVPFPVTLGYEGAGVVAALGPGVTGFSIGQPVHVLHMACYGTYAEYMAVTADDVVAMPDGLDFDSAAAAFNYFVAWGLLSQIVQAECGQSLYIGGAAGGIGTAVIQLAQLAGRARARQREHLPEVRVPARLGVEQVFNHRERDDVEAVRELTGGHGVDYVYDQVAGPRFCRQFDMLATYGQIILYNFLGGYPEDKEIVHILQSRCEGCYGIRYFSIHVHDTDPQGFRDVKRHVLGMMAEGKLARPSTGCYPFPRRGRPTR